MPPNFPSDFWPSLLIYHALPLHAPFTTWLFNAPFGRFASKSSRFNLNGNLAWFCSEIVAPTAFVYTMIFTPHPPLSRATSIISAIYLMHYAHRAIISPLVLSPKRSPLHPIVASCIASYSYLNARLVALTLALNPPSSQLTPRFWLCIAGWALGFAGNGTILPPAPRPSSSLTGVIVYHDEILNDLRRPPHRRLVSSPSAAEKEDARSGDGRYLIPRGGLYQLVSFPNYLCEWLEWTCYALVASPNPFLSKPDLSDHYISSFVASWFPNSLLSPPWMFLAFLISAMVPRAIQGHDWYHRTFGDRYPKERKAVIPWVL